MSKERIKEMKMNLHKRLFQQAEHMRTELGIDSVDKAVEYFESWQDEQIIRSGLMQDEMISKMKMCTLLSHSIEPSETEDFSINDTLFGWDIYWKVKDKGLI